MKKKSVKFSVACMDCYYGTMEVDSNLPEEDIISVSNEYDDEDE